LKSIVDSAPQPDGYCTVINPGFPVKNRNLCDNGDKYNVGWKYDFHWYNAEALNIKVRCGMDFGWGGFATLDNNLIWEE